MADRVHHKYRELAARLLRTIHQGQTIPGEEVESTARLLQDLARALPKDRPRRRRKPQVVETVWLAITYNRLDDGTGDLYVDVAALDDEGESWEPRLETMEAIIAEVVRFLRERDEQRPELDNSE